MSESSATPSGRGSRPRVGILRQTNHYELPVRREAEALVGAGFDVDVILMRGRGSPARETVNGVDITYLPTSLGKSNKLRYLFDYARFFALASATLTKRHFERRYAAVQVNTMPDFLVFAAIPPKLFGARVVAYMHEPSPELAETVFGPTRISRVLALVEQAVLRFADSAITVTDQLKARYVERGARAEKITVVLNGVDPETRLGSWSPSDAGLVDSKFKVISHGSIEDRYGQDTLVEAARILRAEMPELEVILAGRGKAEQRVLEQIEASGLQDIVRFEGWVSEERLNDLLHAADVGVVAQKASPYSHLVHTNKMVDFWIFGLPVIASRLDAVSATYDESVLEFFEPGDAVDLARAIRQLREDPARRDELARNGRQAHERYGWNAQKRAYLGVFEALMKGRRGRRLSSRVHVDR